MNNYFIAFSWGIIILFSWIGWGSIINRILFPKDEFHWGQQASWGVAWMIFVGGILNLTWSISKPTIFVLLAMGLLSWCFQIWHYRQSLYNAIFYSLKNLLNKKVLLIGTILIISLLLIEYSSIIFTFGFHPHDDYQGYLVFSQKMIETGSMGIEPFSERRLISSLGGQYFLHTLVLSMLSRENLLIIDPGLARIIFFGLTLGFLRDSNVNPEMRLLILLPLLLIPAPTSNITSLVMISALFFSLFQFLFWAKLESNKIFNDSCIISLITAGIIASKASLIPAVIILFCASYLSYFLRSTNKQKVIYELLASMLITTILLLPWMISMYQSFGTLLYPLLGKGYHMSAYDHKYLSPTDKLLTPTGLSRFLLSIANIYFVSLLLTSVFYLRYKPWKLPELDQRLALFSLIISSILGTLIILIVTGAYPKSLRYYFPLVITTVIVLTITSVSYLNIKNNIKPYQLMPILVNMIMMGMMIGGGNGWENILNSYKEKLLNIKSMMVKNPSVTTQEEIEQYTKMQQAIPPGEIIFSRLSKPFLLNFKRNTIYIIDAPATSLPPGLPFFKGSQAFADYLISHSIRYIAYNYKNPPTVDKRYWQERLKKEGEKIHPWVRNHAIYTIELHDNIESLGKTRKRIYDDGKIFVIDLMTHQ